MSLFTVALLASLSAIALAHKPAGFSFADFRVPSNFTDSDEFLYGNRIVNGKDAKLGQFPHQVSLRIQEHNSHFCGGSIISSRWIITAGHCSFIQPQYHLIAVAGANKLSAGGATYVIEKIVVHPLYVYGLMRNDIAMWRTATDIVFNANVQPAALPTEQPAPRADATVSGWGRIAYPPPPGSQLPDNLQYLQTKSIPKSICELAFAAYPPILAGNDFNTLVCTRLPAAGNCHGDSGGPLIQGQNILIGVVSWGIPCGAGFPDAHTKVFHYLGFIENTLNSK